jgi:hypothetical protein
VFIAGAVLHKHGLLQDLYLGSSTRPGSRSNVMARVVGVTQLSISASVAAAGLTTDRKVQRTAQRITAVHNGAAFCALTWQLASPSEKRVVKKDAITGMMVFTGLNAALMAWRGWRKE